MSLFSAPKHRLCGLAALRLPCLLISLAFLAACWNQAGSDGGQRAYNPYEIEINAATVSELASIWSRSFGGETTSPISSNGRTYVASAGVAYSLDAATGAIVWSRALGGQIGAPALLGRWIWWPSNNGSTGALHKLRAADGELLDTLEGDALYGPLVADGDWLVIRSTEFFEDFCNLGPDFPLASGARILRTRGSTEHLQNLDHLNIGDLDRCLILDPEFPLPLALRGSRLFVSRPVAGTVEARTIACDDPGDIIQPPDGRCTRWESRVDPISGPVVAHSQVAVASAAGLRVLDSKTGALLFGGDLALSPVRPAAGPSHYIAVTEVQKLAVYSSSGCGAQLCDPAFEAQLAAPLAEGGQPAITPDLVFVGLSNGDVLAYPQDGCGSPSCDPLWADNVGSSVIGAPVPAGGRLFVATEDGQVIAYAPASP